MNTLGEKFDELYEKYYDAIYKYFSKRVNLSDAEDLTQQTFLKLWIWLPKFHEIKSEKAFIFTVAKNTLVDYFRLKKAMEKNVDFESLFDIGSSEDFTKELEIKAAINKLSQKEKTIIGLKSDGYNSREIGENLKLSPSTIRTYIENIRKKLK